MSCLKWIPLAERMPSEEGPPILVTNNLAARNAFGHKSHVWLVSMIHRIEPGEETVHGEDKLAKWGQFMAFSEFDQVIANLTHWADPWQPAPDLLEAAERSLSWLSSYPGGNCNGMYEQMRAAIANSKGE